MNPSKKNCTACPVHYVCNYSMAEGGDEEIDNMTEAEKLKCLHEVVKATSNGGDTFGDKLANLFEEMALSNEEDFDVDLPKYIRAMDKTFKQEEALDSQAMLDAFIAVDIRLERLEAKEEERIRAQKEKETADLANEIRASNKNH